MSAVRLGSNIASLTAQRRLAEGTSALSRTFERLSSGQRINRASDDAAGLAISQSLRADSKVFAQGVRNLNDGISLLNVGDSAIENLSSILVRLQELAAQAANSTYGANQRKSLDAEAQALSKEYFRIARSTSFNGRGLFFAEFGALRLQGGYGTEGGIQSGLGGAIGTGTFAGTVSYLTIGGGSFNGEASDVALGDLNGDGITDMVTANYYDSGGWASVRLGRGDGTFGGFTAYTVGQPLAGDSNAITLGDLNGDGILDLVATSVAGASIRIGAGDGSFGAEVTYAMESVSSHDVALGDLNGDGILDLVTAGVGGGSGRATVRLGAGDGTFGAAKSYASESASSSAVALGDLNSDGILDLVTAGNGGGGTTTVRIGLGDGSFGATISYTTPGALFASVLLGDLNGDGILDMAATTQTDISIGTTIVRLGSGSGSFGSSTSYDNSFYSRSMELGDVNGDGALDLITGGLTTTRVRLGVGNGSFGSASTFSGSLLDAAMALGDLNGDGVLDLVTSGESGMVGSVTIRISETVAGVAPLLPFSLTTLADARQALPVFKQKLDQLAAQRGQIGAFQSRITVASNVLQVTSENFKAAESRIRDADMAQESADLVRLNILQQAASSVLAQANQQPAIAIRLLQQ